LVVAGAVVVVVVVVVAGGAGAVVAGAGAVVAGAGAVVAGAGARTGADVAGGAGLAWLKPEVIAARDSAAMQKGRSTGFM
jgi:hypothetical protein